MINFDLNLGRFILKYIFLNKFKKDIFLNKFKKIYFENPFQIWSQTSNYYFWLKIEKHHHPVNVSIETKIKNKTLKMMNILVVFGGMLREDWEGK